ncbi:hypothetical protein B0H34DRAFT_798127 [Crassisporium funariophilum]|nr:hypothetical protein B0H34DRAFT_798127 [Crassisporium funariophilum]
MKKLAAHDFEDLLQCAIPVFEGLLPQKHDGIVRKLLFELSTWHGLAKLRLHTETTINDLENSTIRLGSILREFQSTVCNAYDTYDLPSEEAARGRRQSALASKQSQKNKSTIPQAHATGRPGGSQKIQAATDAAPAQTRKKRPKREFSLGTYKTHALGGYVKAIWLFGTTDDLSSAPFGDEEPLPPTAPEAHHHISLETRQRIQLSDWLKRNKEDPALKDFLPRLKNHILARLLLHKYKGDELEFTPEDRSMVIIENNTIYQHKVLRVNYTTYDLRLNQDSMNPRTRNANFMVLAPEDNDDPHPYWYGRILGIFHANIRHRGPLAKSREPQRMEFLFVRWFGRDPTPQPGWRTKRLTRLAFVQGNSELAFGFLDPTQVIRAVHLIPAFQWGCVSDLLPPSVIARGVNNPTMDWQLYYLSIFSDRDLMMRFRGGGVGHASTREATDYFKSDRDIPDQEKTSVETEDDENQSDMEVEELQDLQDVQEDANEEGDYGYTRESGDDEDSDCEAGDESDGSKEDGGAVDSDMDALSYADY